MTGNKSVTWDICKKQIRDNFCAKTENGDRILKDFDFWTDPGNSPDSVIKIRKLLDDLSGHYHKMDMEFALIILAISSREHLLFLGKPGIAKTSIIVKTMKEIQSRCNGIVNTTNIFQTCLHPYTQISEILGPIDLRKLLQNEVTRIPRIQKAHLAMVDEFFKATSSLLNTLLSIMNERCYFDPNLKSENEEKVLEDYVPLVSLLAASNKTPSIQRGELEAIIDRFAIIHVMESIIGKILSTSDESKDHVVSKAKTTHIKKIAEELSPFLIKGWGLEYEFALNTFLRHYNAETSNEIKRKIHSLQLNKDNPDAMSVLGHLSAVYFSLFNDSNGNKLEIIGEQKNVVYELSKILLYTNEVADISPRRVIKLLKLMFCREKLFGSSGFHAYLANNYDLCRFMGKTDKEIRDLKIIGDFLLTNK
ncbi:MAG: AAA family ATPase [Spirochaetales bacterium]|nr:AAA family ATPase [Spirochaetales bacterium]